MELATAYEILGLQPLDEFIAAAEEDGRRIGATTAMIVAAALAIRQGLPVMLVMRNLRHANQNKKKLLEIIEELNKSSGTPVLLVKGQGNKSFRFTSGGALMVSSETTMWNTGTDQWFVFRDVEWAMVIRNRLKEALDRARYLLRHEGPPVVYKAYDSVWDYLFEVSEGGAAVVLSQDVTTTLVDSVPQEARPYIDIW